MGRKTTKKLTKPELLNLLLEKENKEINQMDEMVDLLVSKNLSVNVNSERAEALTFGEKMSDGVAKFAGSWRFIISFLVIIGLWVASNLYFFTHPFDKFPFILLNLLLSCIAALQAPIIMMSQNRQEKKDRIRSNNDYKIDLKAEFILEDMYHKLDTIIKNQDKLKEQIKKLEDEKKDII
ncbi:MAG: DUF1003 domain-containing protein [Bacilli bacterium]|nr:DUF1003 domain-containing protein [Bacilli bacterium]